MALKSLACPVAEVVRQLGDLVCDCSVISFLDKREPVCAAVAAPVITSVTAVSTVVDVSCVGLFTLQMLLFFGLSFGFFKKTGVWGSQDAAQDDVF